MSQQLRIDPLMRQAQILNTEPSTLLQSKPKTSYSRNVDTKKGNIKEKYENVLKIHQ